MARGMIWRNTCFTLYSDRTRLWCRQSQAESEIIMRAPMTPRTIRRLLAADGYLHLELPQLAANELEKIENAGPLEGPRRLLLGLALKRAGDPEQAIEHLETAARVMPTPVRSFAWSELAACYRSMGSNELANLAESLGGQKTYELRIALPFGEITIESTMVTTEVV